MTDVASVPAQLLDLQRIDTEVDQLLHRREHLPERATFTAATEARTAWERRRAAMAARMAELSGVIERAEHDDADLLTHKQRLEQQLKTVIAPREAEALMHEITAIDGKRDELDTTELAALEEQAALDDEMIEQARAEQPLVDALAEAERALDVADSEIAQELARLEAARSAVRDGLPDHALVTYDRMRDRHGVAVARLEGKKCAGCHLDLSAAEIDTAKDEAAETGITTCPQCGRMLIV